MYNRLCAKEAIGIYRLNKIGKAKRHTPIGETNTINANNIEIPGKLTWPKLRRISTGKVNENDRKYITKVGRKTKIEMCIFADDINYARSEKVHIHKVVKNP